MNIYIHTFGCRLNQYESEKISYELKSMGLNIGEIEDSHAVVINTCTVTKDSDKKLTLYLDKLKEKEDKKIFLIGCFVSKNADFKRDNVILIPNEKKDEASQIIFNTLKKSADLEDIEYKNNIFFPQNQSRAYLKIEDGCNVFCSYCIVSRIRGEQKSVEPNKIYEAIKLASEYNYREIVLTGLNLGSYNYNSMNFTNIVKNILEISSKLNIRIRLSSVEPIYFEKELINMFKYENILCPHAHIPLQSGSDKILKLMNRRYDRKHFLNIIENLYKANENMAITTDVMVGFPQETKEDFNDTYSLCKQSKFLKMHIFRYSNREDTPAAKMQGQIGYRSKLSRAHILNELNESMREEYYKKSIGRKLNVIVEKNIEKNIYIGTSGEYLKVKFRSNIQLEKKSLNRVTAEKIENGYIIGT